MCKKYQTRPILFSLYEWYISKTFFFWADPSSEGRVNPDTEKITEDVEEQGVRDSEELEDLEENDEFGDLESPRHPNHPDTV